MSLPPERLESYPLSPIQQGMYYDSLLSSPGIYLLQILLTLREPLEAARLWEALQQVTARHPVLRTAFQPGEDGMIWQVVFNQVRVPGAEIDLRGLPAGQQEIEIERLVREDHLRGMDLDQAPLMRASLILLGPDENRLLLTIYHAVVDSRSFMLVLRELFTIYDALRAKRDPDLATPTPYREYVEWMQAQDFSTAEAFWRSQLQGYSAPITIDLLHEGGEIVLLVPEGELEFGKEALELDPQTGRRLEALASEHDLTLNTIFQGAWGILLSRYSGESDVVFGATRACQRSALNGRTESLVGPVLNTLPLRVQVESEQPLIPYLQELRRSWVDMRPYENTPLAQVTAWSDLPSGVPLFSTFTNFEYQTHTAILQSFNPAWQARSMDLIQHAPYPLVAGMRTSPGITISLVYDRHKYEKKAVQRMLGHLRVLLEDIGLRPNCSLGELRILPNEERQQILVAWNSGRGILPALDSIPNRFETQVERTPERLAVSEGWAQPETGEARQLTYRELNARANRLARRLRKLGAGPEVRVGVCLQRSLEYVVGFLAILKAGAVYVPLDPDHPADRLAYIIQDCGLQIVLTQSSLVENLPAQIPHALVLDTPDPAWETVSGANLEIRDLPQSLVYVIYTSGSTGRPKGVMITYRVLCNFMNHLLALYDLGPGDRLLMQTPISFDPSIYDPFLPFLLGAQLVLASPGRHGDIPYVIDTTLKYRITIWHMVTSLVDTLMEDPRALECNSVRYLVTGGESMPPNLPAKLARLPGLQGTNGYGPAETCIRATDVWLPMDGRWRFNSIGSPIENIQIYILDENLQPQPVGVPGEVFIGGVGVGRGYLNQPALTASRFIPDPFGAPGGRLYRTGDRGRWHADGQIEFLGRRDSQVKLNGVRIELEEIERALEGHPGIRRAAVLLRSGKAGHFLAGFVQPAPDAVLQSDELKTFLRRRLPDSMLPSTFSILQALPSLPSGKINRLALQSIQMDEPTLHPAYQPPGTPLEQVLSEIFASVLCVDRIGLHDSFFAYGGHSLLVMKAVSQINDLFQTRLPLRTLFEASNIESLTKWMQADAPEAERLGQIASLALELSSRQDSGDSKEQ